MYDERPCSTEGCLGESAFKLTKSLILEIADDNEQDTFDVYYKFKISHIDFPEISPLEWTSRKYKIKKEETSMFSYSFAIHTAINVQLRSWDRPTYVTVCFNKI